MNTIKSDLNYIFNDKKGDTFAYLYSRTNEDLKSLFEIIDVRDKNILSVLSSSDYLFSALFKEAGNIETFDINSITFRYYFLRKWLIQNGYVDAGKICTQDIFKIISSIRTDNQCEKDSVLFWKYFFNLSRCKKDCLYYYDNLFIDIAAKKMIYEENLRDVADTLDGYKLQFKHMNVCNGFYPDKKYDVIFLSNIMDYNRNSKSRIEDIRDNLDDLLTDDGIIVMSHFKFFSGFNIEHEVFSNTFDYIPLDIIDSSIIYYAYKKKKKYYNGAKIKTR